MIKTKNKPDRFQCCILVILFVVLCSPLSFADDLPEDVKRIIAKFNDGDVEQGTLAMSEYEKHNSDSQYLPYIWMAGARAQKGIVKARAFYLKITDSFPGSSLAPLAQIELAQLLFVHGNATGACAEARRLLRNYPKHEKAFDALMILAATDARSGRIKLAANRYAEAAIRFDSLTKSARAYAGLGDCKFRLDELTGAKDAYWKALEKHDAGLDAGKIYYQLGLIASKRNRTGEARRYFILLVRDYPDSRFSKPARSLLKTMGDARGNIGVSGNNLLPPVRISRVFYSVKVGSYDTREKASMASKRFSKAGSQVNIILKDNRYLVLVGKFTGEMDTFIFAEELERKFGLKTEIIKLGDQESE